jgi:flagellar motor switch protein FliG
MEELLTSSLGPEKSEELLDALNRRFIPTSPFKGLARYPREILVKVLENEHPQTIALALSNIESNRAAQVITGLEEELRLDIITRIAKLKHPPSDIAMSIAAKLRDKADQAMKDESPEDIKERLKTVADVLNRVDKETEKSVLGQISETDADMAEEIKELMFTFDDLILVDKRAMQKVLSGINVQVLSLSLKAAKKDVEDYIMSNVSKRVKKLIEEEKELMGPKTIDEVTEAQKEIVATVRMLIETGEITINRASEEELLV